MIFYPRPVPIDAYRWYPVGPHPEPNPVQFRCIDGYYIQQANGIVRLRPGDWIYREEHAPDVYHVMDADTFVRKFQALSEFDPAFVLMSMNGQKITQPLQLEDFGRR